MLSSCIQSVVESPLTSPVIHDAVDIFLSTIFNCDASLSVSSDESDFVNKWSDYKARGFFVAQETGGNQPETGYFINGLPAIRFQSKYMIQAGNSFPSDCSLFIVEKGLAASGNDSHIVGTDGNPTTGTLFCGFNTDTSAKFALQGAGTLNSVIPDYNSRDVSVWEYRISNSLNAIYRNNVLLNSNAGGQVVTGNFMIGAGATASFRATDSLIGQVALIGSTVDREAITTALMTKWGVA